MGGGSFVGRERRVDGVALLLASLGQAFGEIGKVRRPLHSPSGRGDQERYVRIKLTTADELRERVRGGTSEDLRRGVIPAGGEVLAWRREGHAFNKTWLALAGTTTEHGSEVPFGKPSSLRGCRPAYFVGILRCTVRQLID